MLGGFQAAPPTADVRRLGNVSRPLRLNFRAVHPDSKNLKHTKGLSG